MRHLARYPAAVLHWSHLLPRQEQQAAAGVGELGPQTLVAAEGQLS
jgi:hypothetical protein